MVDDASTSSSECPLWMVVSSGRRNTLSQTREIEWTSDGSKICSRVQRGGQGGVVEPLGGAHSQFNRVARQLNERSRETSGFETRAERDLMLVLRRPIEPTAIRRYCIRSPRQPQLVGSDGKLMPSARAVFRWMVLRWHYTNLLQKSHYILFRPFLN
jgi:hypothetical protein